jgi:hypothetical protein
MPSELPVTEKIAAGFVAAGGSPTAEPWGAISP